MVAYAEAVEARPLVLPSGGKEVYFPEQLSITKLAERTGGTPFPLQSPNPREVHYPGGHQLIAVRQAGQEELSLHIKQPNGSFESHLLADTMAIFNDGQAIIVYPLEINRQSGITTTRFIVIDFTEEGEWKVDPVTEEVRVNRSSSLVAEEIIEAAKLGREALNKKVSQPESVITSETQEEREFAELFR